MNAVFPPADSARPSMSACMPDPPDSRHWTPRGAFCGKPLTKRCADGLILDYRGVIRPSGFRRLRRGLKVLQERGEFELTQQIGKLILMWRFELILFGMKLDRARVSIVASFRLRRALSACSTKRF